MMWLLQLALAHLNGVQGINVCFVLLNLAAACGLSPRRVAVASAVLYLVMIFA